MWKFDSIKDYRLRFARLELVRGGQGKTSCERGNEQNCCETMHGMLENRSAA